jgi:hypothetical protein
VRFGDFCEATTQDTTNQIRDRTQFESNGSSRRGSRKFDHFRASSSAIYCALDTHMCFLDIVPWHGDKATRPMTAVSPSMILRTQWL